MCVLGNGSVIHLLSYTNGIMIALSIALTTTTFLTNYNPLLYLFIMIDILFFIIITFYLLSIIFSLPIIIIITIIIIHFPDALLLYLQQASSTTREKNAGSQLEWHGF